MINFERGQSAKLYGESIICEGRIVLEKGRCNGGSRSFVLEVSTLKAHPEAAIQVDNLKAFV